ncbi:hypothetical protein JRO89_XS01G0304700 [Xanthoceras sorbifolium]|uniref:CRM domain-containing protein n=1 Tax=Xanthoceras sorbifolium TaxID=99658 RepID=A0ABQ8INZ1_9ROSI|nr:hypothetical protein JRO89_XS01G0304700 [Xanthoceras sorbifolium]
MFLTRLSRHKLPRLTRHLSSVTTTTNTGASYSKLRDHYSFKPPPSLSPTPQNPNPNPIKKKSKPKYRPPSSLDAPKKIRSNLPFDFRYSYTESSPTVRPIGLREPKFSPFGPGRLDREWTGVCAPAVDPKARSEGFGGEVSSKSKQEANFDPFSMVLFFSFGVTCLVLCLLVHCFVGRDGLTHNMLNDIHNHWKHAEATRIRCLGVPTVDMKNVCTQLEDKTSGQIIFRHCGTLVLYRGRNYNPKKRPVVPLMMWRPHEPVYPRLIKTTIDGLSIEETKEMRKRGLAVPALTKLAKNGYYGSLVPMVRDAFLVSELVRIDCKGLEKSDYKKIGCKLRDLVPCVLVTFEKEQIVVWRGKDYKPPVNDAYFLTHRESFDNPESDSDCSVEERDSTIH